MCLILFAWKQDSTHRLVLLANRDEYFTRPTQALHRWENSRILAGKDLLGGGTWLGVHESGRWAALTNYRQPANQNSNAPSRGLLTEHYLRGNLAPDAYLNQIASSAEQYNGFNLLVGDTNQLFYFSNREGDVRELGPGIYGLSNHLLDSNWPKVHSGKSLLQKAIAQQADDEHFFRIMQDRQVAEKSALPDTGVGELMESLLSPRFIHIPQAAYGTRSTTLLKMRDDQLVMKELNYAEGEPLGLPSAFEQLINMC